MADLNGAGGTTFGGLTGTGEGQVESWSARITSPIDGLNVFTAITVKMVSETWDAGAVDVRLQVDDDPAFGSPHYDAVHSVTSAPTGVQVTGLTDGVTYYARCRVEPSTSSYVGSWSGQQFDDGDPIEFTAMLDVGHGHEYVVLNVGVEITPEDDGVEYVVENVGVETTLSPDGHEYVVENVGVEVTRSPDANEYVVENVDATTPTPHLWFLKPASGRAGDGIALYGWGFGDLSTTYNGVVEVDFGGVVGWTAVPIVSWQTFPPDADAYTANRTLDEVMGVIDMQHTVIEIVVPDGALPPGYPVRVRTNGP